MVPVGCLQSPPTSGATPLSTPPPNPHTCSGRGFKKESGLRQPRAMVRARPDWLSWQPNRGLLEPRRTQKPLSLSWGPGPPAPQIPAIMISYKLVNQDKKLAYQRNTLSVPKVHSPEPTSASPPVELVPNAVLRPQSGPAESHAVGEPGSPVVTRSPVMVRRSSLIPATLQQNLSPISFHVEGEPFAFRNRCLHLKNKQNLTK